MNPYTAKSALFFSLLLLIACQKRQTPAKQETMPSAGQDSIREADKDDARLDSLAAIAKTKTIWGPRLTVVGDFDGDGTNDTLLERYISRVSGKETNKDYEFGEGFDGWIDVVSYKQRWTAEKDPLVQLTCKNPRIKTFNVEAGGAQDGFGYLENAGDLNADGTDEIVYYIHDVDVSNMNSCALATYKNGKWKEVHHWDIMEWEFFDEEETGTKLQFVKKVNGKVYCKEMDFDAGDYVWKQLKTNW